MEKFANALYSAHENEEAVKRVECFVWSPVIRALTKSTKRLPLTPARGTHADPVEDTDFNQSSVTEAHITLSSIKC